MCQKENFKIIFEDDNGVLKENSQVYQMDYTAEDLVFIVKKGDIELVVYNPKGDMLFKQLLEAPLFEIPEFLTAIGDFLIILDDHINMIRGLEKEKALDVLMYEGIFKITEDEKRDL